MADSLRERIFQAVNTILENVDGIGEVLRGRGIMTDINRYPAAWALPGTDDVTDYLGDSIDRDLNLRIYLEFYSEKDIHADIEAFLPKVQQAMVADHTLGGLVIDCNEDGVAEPFPLNDQQTMAGVVVDYSIKYRVKRLNPYQQG